MNKNENDENGKYIKLHDKMKKKWNLFIFYRKEYTEPTV